MNVHMCMYMHVDTHPTPYAAYLGYLADGEGWGRCKGVRVGAGGEEGGWCGGEGEERHVACLHPPRVAVQTLGHLPG